MNTQNQPMSERYGASRTLPQSDGSGAHVPVPLIIRLKGRVGGAGRCSSLDERLRPATSDCGHLLVTPRLVGAAFLVLLVAAVVLVVLRPEAVWGLDGPSLEASVEDAFPYEIENCVRVDGDNWRCDYALDALSGVAGPVDVRQRGDRCWSASTEATENSPSESAQGCVSAWQFFKAM
jgi:hypothetical protein